MSLGDGEEARTSRGGDGDGQHAACAWAAPRSPAAGQPLGRKRFTRALGYPATPAQPCWGVGSSLLGRVGAHLRALWWSPPPSCSLLRHLQKQPVALLQAFPIIMGGWLRFSRSVDGLLIQGFFKVLSNFSFSKKRLLVFLFPFLKDGQRIV